MSSYHHGNLRAALLERAIAEIGARGVEGLSLRELARGLGVSHAAPKRHFASKADLLSAIVATAYGELTEAILGQVETEDAVGRLRDMARIAIEWAIANPAKFSVMSNPDVSRFATEDVKAALTDFADAVRAAITEAQKSGYKKNMSTEALLLHSVGATFGVATLMTDPLMQRVLSQAFASTAIEKVIDEIVPMRDGASA